MKTLVSFLQAMLMRRKQTGKIYKLNPRDDMVTLYDLSLWNDDMAQEVLDKFPDASFSVESNSQSLSGFVVHVRSPSPPTSRVWMTSLYLCCIFFVVYILIGL